MVDPLVTVAIASAALAIPPTALAAFAAGRIDRHREHAAEAARPDVGADTLVYPSLAEAVHTLGHRGAHRAVRGEAPTQPIRVPASIASALVLSTRETADTGAGHVETVAPHGHHRWSTLRPRLAGWARARWGSLRGWLAERWEQASADQSPGWDTPDGHAVLAAARNPRLYMPRHLQPITVSRATVRGCVP